MGVTRLPAVAGSFYPAEPRALADTVTRFLDKAEAPQLDLKPRMLIVPHAGYIYSGPVAAIAYGVVARLSTLPSRVVMLGPAHFVPFEGLAAPTAEYFQTPLGTVAVDPIPARVPTNASAHRREHSLEVQLPFLQAVLGDFTLLPLLTGRIDPREAAEVLADSMTPPNSLVVISSDLSHYQPYEAAQTRDRATADAIAGLIAEKLDWEDACGLTAIQAGLLFAREQGWRCRLLDLRNSGDTAGDKNQVVGYGAFAIGPESQ